MSSLPLCHDGGVSKVRSTPHPSGRSLLCPARLGLIRRIVPIRDPPMVRTIGLPQFLPKDLRPYSLVKVSFLSRPGLSGRFRLSWCRLPPTQTPRSSSVPFVPSDIETQDLQFTGRLTFPHEWGALRGDRRLTVSLRNRPGGFGGSGHGRDGGVGVNGG